MAIEVLAELTKSYYEFFKANYDNLEFFDVQAMKAENANAGVELEKTVKHIKEILNKPFGRQEESIDFDPLNLQKDIPDKKKPDALNFLNKKKQTEAKQADLLNNDLLGLDLTSSPISTPSNATSNNHTNSSPQQTESKQSSKPNALNFIKKQEQPKQQPITNNLLDIDLLGESIPQSNHQAPNQMDLFDLTIPLDKPHDPTKQENKSLKNNTSQPFNNNLLDLSGVQTTYNPPININSKPKIDNNYDFGLM